MQEHLSRQLHLFANSEDERKIGESIIGNINDNGYLDCPIDEIAESNRTTKSQVEKVLVLIQTFDPIGVGARDLRECLWLQLKVKREENSVAGQIVDKYLAFLEKKRYGYIAKKLKRSVEEIKDAIKEIAKLEPKPGCSFSQEITQRLIPDAILKKNKDGYDISFFILQNLHEILKYKTTIILEKRSKLATRRPPLSRSASMPMEAQ